MDGKASTWLQTLESVCSDPSPTDPGRIQEGGKAKEFGGGAEGDTRGISGRRATRVSARPDSNPSERPALLRERENPIKSAGKEKGEALGNSRHLQLTPSVVEALRILLMLSRSRSNAAWSHRNVWKRAPPRSVPPDQSHQTLITRAELS